MVWVPRICICNRPTTLNGEKLPIKDHISRRRLDSTKILGAFIKSGPPVKYEKSQLTLHFWSAGSTFRLATSLADMDGDSSRSSRYALIKICAFANWLPKVEHTRPLSLPQEYRKDYALPIQRNRSNIFDPARPFLRAANHSDIKGVRVSLWLAVTLTDFTSMYIGGFFQEHVIKKSCNSSKYMI